MSKDGTVQPFLRESFLIFEFRCFAAANMPDDQLFARICERVEREVADCSYTLPPVFRLPPEHPFASAVNSRFVPCYPADRRTPYVLMEGLAPQLADPDNPGSLIPVDLIRLPLRKIASLKNVFEKNQGNRAAHST